MLDGSWMHRAVVKLHVLLVQAYVLCAEASPLPLLHSHQWFHLLALCNLFNERNTACKMLACAPGFQDLAVCYGSALHAHSSTCMYAGPAAAAVAVTAGAAAGAGAAVLTSAAATGHAAAALRRKQRLSGTWQLAGCLQLS